SYRPVQKSRASLKFRERAVRSKARAICWEMDFRRLPMTAAKTGSTLLLTAPPPFPGRLAFQQDVAVGPPAGRESSRHDDGGVHPLDDGGALDLAGPHDFGIEHLHRRRPFLLGQVHFPLRGRGRSLGE